MILLIYLEYQILEIVSLIICGSQSSSNVQGSDSYSTYLYSTAEASNASASPAAPPPLRRSGRNRQAPIRYGEWVCQQSAENPDLVEHFV